MEELKPCPFCGKNSGVVEKVSLTYKDHDTFYVTCDTDGCVASNMMEQDEQGGCPVEYNSEEEAIKAWNTRPIENYRDSMNYEEMMKVVELAHKYGWNGVENSKFLSTFFEDLLNEIIDLQGH